MARAKVPNDPRVVDVSGRGIPAWLHFFNDLARPMSAVADSAETYPLTTVADVSAALQRVEAKLNLILATERAAGLREI